MEENQAAGYLFEDEIISLLKKSNFVDVKEETLEGRGTNHQIDAYGIYSIPVPFTYPIRLIAEAKCFEKSIQLPLVRSFFGVITDISQNYFVKRGDKELKERFLDTGCFFAANSFTKSSQDFAWAHNIFLISFSGIRYMDGIKKQIREFLNIPEIKEEKKIDKLNLIAYYKRWKKDQRSHNEILQQDNPTIVFGIINNRYPVILVGKKGWHENIYIPPATDKIEGKKISRKTQRGSVLFEIEVNGERINNGRKIKSTETFFFTIPTGIAKKITGRIKDSNPWERIFNLDIPLITKHKKQPVRRIITIEVTLPIKKKKTGIKWNRDHQDLKIKNDTTRNTRWESLQLIED